MAEIKDTKYNVTSRFFSEDGKVMTETTQPEVRRNDLATVVEDAVRDGAHVLEVDPV